MAPTVAPLREIMITPVNLGLGQEEFTLAVHCADGTYEAVVTFKTRHDAEKAGTALASGG